MADIAASNWNEADASNSTAAPDGAPEGMFPSGVNDTMRAMMGATKRWYDQTIPLVTGGTSTAYTLSYAVTPTALADGMTHLVLFNAVNGAAATLNVNALGAKPIYTYQAAGWAAAPAGVITANSIVRVNYDSASGAYRVHKIQSAGIWTPTDGSGAGLTFSSVNANYQVIGNMVYAYFQLVYPATANGSSAIITLPVAVPNQTYAHIPQVVYTAGAGSGVLIKPIPNTSTAVFIAVSGAGLTNANMSTFTVSGIIIYPAS